MELLVDIGSLTLPRLFERKSIREASEPQSGTRSSLGVQGSFCANALESPRKIAVLSCSKFLQRQFDLFKVVLVM